MLRLHALKVRERAEYWERLRAPVEIAALRLSFDYAGMPVPAEPETDPRLREGETVVVIARDEAAEEAPSSRAMRRCS